jgi:hypothetical protein
MYLASLKRNERFFYQIRRSIETNEENHIYEVLFDLGDTPSDFFTIIEDHIVIFDEDLLKTLERTIKKNPEPVLEKLLFDFLPSMVQQQLLTFKGRTARYKGRLTPEEIQDITRQIHIFDRRRLYYLRYGAVDQSRLTKMHEKCCRPLLGQSRDEREFYFMEAEKVLDPGFYFQYIFAIFNLKNDFLQSFAPWLPEALVREEVADSFINAICRLQKDPSFWKGEEAGAFLHPHLFRYICMFFDYIPHSPSYENDFSRAFMGQHRTFRWPEPQNHATPEAIVKLFGVSHAALKSMSKTELSRLYRKKALELHPDQGGDAEQFIVLTQIYTSFLQQK